MAKNKDKKKVPFNTFRKGLTAGLLGLTMMAGSAGLFAGCAGEPGAKGETGATGKSAYELAVEQGFQGTLTEWLDSLKGQSGGAGNAGDPGRGITSITKTGTVGLVDTYTITFTDGSTTTFTITNGQNGTNGDPGQSNYVWIKYADAMPDSNDDMKDIASAYIGVYNGTSATAPTDYTAYTWHKIVGEDGTPGASSYTHIKYANEMPDNNDDILDSGTGDYIGIYVGTSSMAPADYTAYTWHKIKGEQGEPGQDGEDGISAYVGYDGNLWYGTQRSDLQIEDYTESGVFENSIKIPGSEMEKYFDREYVNLSSNTIALMSNYMPNAKLTQYSGVKVNELSIYAEDAGLLQIGTAKVADVIDARLSGVTYSLTSQFSFSVQKGLNDLVVNIEVAEDETLVVGGNNSVGLYVSKGITKTGVDGDYTLINGNQNAYVLEMSDNIKNTLALKVKATPLAGIKAVFPDLLNQVNSAMQNSSLPGAVQSFPFHYGKKDLFANKQIVKIGLIPKACTDFDNPTFTVYKVRQSQTTNYTGQGNYIEKYTLQVPISSSNDYGKFVYVDCDITVGENEKIVFGDPSDTVNWGYLREVAPEYSVSENQDPNAASYTCLIFDIYEYSDFTYEDHINKLKEEEINASGVLNAKYEELASILKNKTISILGDSISTYNEYSEGAAAQTSNSTIGSNSLFYTGENIISDVNDTWWMQLINQTEMKLLVNNSFSGDEVWNRGQTRCEQLHDDTGTNAGTEPDFIAVYLGTNDLNRSATVEDFTTNYRNMVNKILTKYTNSEVFLFTLLPNGQPIERQDAFNNAIRSIAEDLNCGLVDINAESGFTSSNFRIYTADGTHPNSWGMDLISECFWNVLYDKYVTNAE